VLFVFLILFLFTGGAQYCTGTGASYVCGNAVLEFLGINRFRRSGFKYFIHVVPKLQQMGLGHPPCLALPCLFWRVPV